MIQLKRHQPTKRTLPALGVRLFQLLVFAGVFWAVAWQFRPLRASVLEKECAVLLALYLKSDLSPKDKDRLLRYTAGRLQRALALNPRNQNLRLLLGSAYLFQGDYWRALGQYKEAEQLRKDSRLYTNLAVCYMYLRDYGEAERHLELALAFHSGFPDALKYKEELQRIRGRN
ncbi:MAG: tetratricopeptide repeat protein [Acidobacteria bacterium]|nr:tetratricopeptide repeat protein [Acidobacteriota bacterium]